MSSGIITIIPLTSDKGKKLHFSEVNLGNEIFLKFKEKYNRLQLELSKKINELAFKSNDNLNLKNIGEATQKLRFMMKIDEELSKMKKGSIAMVSQITTISKQRIYDPQKTGDILSGIRLSNESLDLINDKMKQLFIK